MHVAEMDYDIAPGIREVLTSMIAESDLGYTGPVPELAAGFVNFAQERWGWAVDASQVRLSTDVGVSAISIMRALGTPGDHVVINSPVYSEFYSWVKEVGLEILDVPLVEAQPQWQLDLDALEEAFMTSPKFYLLCHPHNPTGVVFTPDELQQIAAIAIEHDLIVISDEAYEHLWFDEHRHVPIATLPGMFERTVTVGSAGKSFSFTGWKVGWATGPAPLIRAVRTVRQHLSFVSSGPFQYAVAAGLRMGDDYYDAFRHDLQAKRDVLTAGLQDIGFTVVPSAGTYFLTSDLGPYADLGDGMAVARELPHRAGVVAIPIQPFCDHPEIGQHALRWAFCKRPEVLREAVERLARG